VCNVPPGFIRQDQRLIIAPDLPVSRETATARGLAYSTPPGQQYALPAEFDQSRMKWNPAKVQSLVMYEVEALGHHQDIQMAWHGI